MQALIDAVPAGGRRRSGAAIRSGDTAERRASWSVGFENRLSRAGQSSDRFLCVLVPVIKRSGEASQLQDKRRPLQVHLIRFAKIQNVLPA